MLYADELTEVSEYLLRLGEDWSLKFSDNEDNFRIGCGANLKFVGEHCRTFINIGERRDENKGTPVPWHNESTSAAVPGGACSVERR